MPCPVRYQVIAVRGATARAEPGVASGAAAAPEDPDEKARTLADRIKEVPAAVAGRVSEWLAAKYQKLSARYGPSGAKAVLGAMIVLTPTPIPGSSLIPIALAEAVLRVRRAITGVQKSAPALSDEHARALARDLLHELYEAEGEEVGPAEADVEGSDQAEATPDPDHSQALLAALVESVSEAVESGDDPEAAAESFRPYIDDPQLLAGVAEGSVTKATWDSAKHPRDDHGRFVSKEAIHEAKSDPAKAEELRARVTDPAERKKLDAALAGETDVGRTQQGRAKDAAAKKRADKAETKKRADELIRAISAGQLRRGTEPIPADDLHALADHLPAMTVADLRRARMALHASFGGDRRKLEMVERLKAPREGVGGGGAADEAPRPGQEAPAAGRGRYRPRTGDPLRRHRPGVARPLDQLRKHAAGRPGRHSDCRLQEGRAGARRAGSGTGERRVH
jgi:hypothetical protein